jgi:hypothetical protein
LREPSDGAGVGALAPHAQPWPVGSVKDRVRRMGVPGSEMQDEHMETIRARFDDRVRAVVPLFDQELRGAAMLETAAGALFA